MVAKVGDYNPRFADRHVRDMQYAADVNISSVSVFSLGTPGITDPDGIDNDIDADAAAATQTAQTAVADSRYGRTCVMQMNADPGNAAAYDLVGRDYLGQPMKERFTHASGSTAIVYGSKAFYWLDRVDVVTPSSNAVTMDLGWGYRLGLPYKGLSLAWIKQNGVVIPVRPPILTLRATLAAADAAAGRSHFLYSPIPGYIQTLRGISNGGGSTNDPTVTVELSTTAVTGLSVTIDTSNATGNTVTDTPTTPGYNANNRVRAGDRIELVSAAAASAGSVTIEVDIVNHQLVLPDVTDPATVSTGDPRGTFEATEAFDGSKEFEIGLIADNSRNSDYNGGLHGIKHYFA